MERIENVYVSVRNADPHQNTAVGSWREGELKEGAAAGFSLGEVACRRFTRGGDDEIELGVSGTSCPVHGASEEVVELREPQRVLDRAPRARRRDPPFGCTRDCCRIPRLNPYLGTGCKP